MFPVRVAKWRKFPKFLFFFFVWRIEKPNRPFGGIDFFLFSVYPIRSRQRSSCRVSSAPVDTYRTHTRSLTGSLESTWYVRTWYLLSSLMIFCSSISQLRCLVFSNVSPFLRHAGPKGNVLHHGPRTLRQPHW